MRGAEPETPHDRVLGVGEDLGLTLSGWALGSGQVESVTAQCPGREARQKETLAPGPQLGPVHVPVAFGADVRRMTGDLCHWPAG